MHGGTESWRSAIFATKTSAALWIDVRVSYDSVLCEWDPQRRPVRSLLIERCLGLVVVLRQVSSSDTQTHSKRKGGTNISGTISKTTCIFMSMFNDIDSSNKNKEEQYLENVMEIGTDAEQIRQGHWCFCGPGLEKHGAEMAHKKGTGTTVRYRCRKSSSSPTIQHDIHCSSPFFC